MASDTPQACRRPEGGLFVIVFAVFALVAGATLAAATPPPIRTTEQNRIPACVNPERLMAFLRERNSRLDSRYNDIAKWYKTHGETWRVRWDYAFFQMIIETNHLLYRRGNGDAADVKPQQNNFAGLGTTGGGVPGDRYPDVSTGVLAQIQHLVAYSGERLDRPVGPRTQLTQDDIVVISKRLQRPVTFGDLAGRWAVDRRYARSIESVAERFRTSQCSEGNQIAEKARPVVAVEQPAPRRPDKPQVRPEAPAQTTAPEATAQAVVPKLVREPVQVLPSPPPRQGVGRFAAAVVTESATLALPAACRVHAASYVGHGAAAKALLIGATLDGEQHYTALKVLDGFERSMAERFIALRAPGGATLATFESSDQALARAYELCPAAR